ncbi:hypothetical protein NLI96_g1074 [Meripilus lineatus]|uniref:Uncharacterized protein n=1 Tax=Meripilus lineatus TaxID=2056292 RepID=A0AAD5VB81_9APHY|nr:hypothetical protein NLI96_g1074 [Physisporinus lineatus]
MSLTTNPILNPQTPKSQPMVDDSDKQPDIMSKSTQSNQAHNVSSLSESQGRGIGSANTMSAGQNHRGSPQQVQPQEGSSGIGGSAALRELGLQREREAKEIYAQSEEIKEAERLEEAAREHREKAVAAGAHPTYKELGGGVME